MLIQIIQRYDHFNIRSIKPEDHGYKHCSELNDLIHWMEEVRIHRVVKVHQVFVIIIKVKTFDDTGHLLHTEITKKQVEE